MLDAMVPGAAVFEPEEVDVLAMACALAGKTLKSELQDDAAAAPRLARLVHNLGRSRLRLKRRLATENDAKALAAESVELFLYLRGKEQEPVEESVLRPPPRVIPIFPAALRAQPDTILRSRVK